MSDRSTSDTPAGFAFAVSAYTLWGSLPLYMKALDHVGAVELLAHRVVWSVPVAGLVLLALGRRRDIGEALRDRRTLSLAALTAALISINWLTYIWAVFSGRTVDAALGYYINPLFSVLLGAVVLGERLTPAKWLAIGLAAAAVLVIFIDAGRLPVVALVLTVSWGCYALAKRALPVGPNVGFLLEALILSPPAVAWIILIYARGEGHFLAGDAWTSSMLVAAGIVTAGPLILYANGAKRLTLSTIALLQYIAPSLILFVAVAVFGEDVDRARTIALPMIWMALAIYTGAVFAEQRSRRRSVSRR